MEHYHHLLVPRNGRPGLSFKGQQMNSAHQTVQAPYRYVLPYPEGGSKFIEATVRINYARVYRPALGMEMGEVRNITANCTLRTTESRPELLESVEVVQVILHDPGLEGRFPPEEPITVDSDHDRNPGTAMKAGVEAVDYLMKRIQTYRN